VLIWTGVFVSVRRAKIRGFSFCKWGMKVAGQRRARLKFGILQLGLDARRCNCPSVKIGIIYIGKHDTIILDPVVLLILKERCLMVTGWFGKDRSVVEELALRTHAVMDRPICQCAYVVSPQSRADHEDPYSKDGLMLAVMPVYFLMYGEFSKVHVPDQHDIPLWDDWKHACGSTGPDLPKYLIPYDDLPTWHYNWTGSPFVPFMGAVKVKKVDWSRWIGNCWQTYVWLGSSIPSTNRRNNRAWRRWHQGR
jgi:hypothetical protein